jgi:predicted regulator of Ras-like GTPase activity (Roadblock/LC7/MglB family)
MVKPPSLGGKGSDVLSVRQFDEILSDVIKSEAGIKKCILTDRTGLTIAHVSKFSYFAVDIDGIGAIASAVFCASEEQGKNLDIGELVIVTSEFNEGKIFAAGAGKGVLCVITDREVNLGMVRMVMKKAAGELSKVLDEFLAEKPPVEEGKSEAEREELRAALGQLEKG